MGQLIHQAQEMDRSDYHVFEQLSVQGLFLFREMHLSSHNLKIIETVVQKKRLCTPTFCLDPSADKGTRKHTIVLLEGKDFHHF